VRVGVDVVSKARIAADLARWGDLFLRRPLTAEEERWCREVPAPADRLAVCLAVKEAAIKALGGRPTGFNWRNIELLAWEASGMSTALDPVAAELERAFQSPVERRPCRVRTTTASGMTSNAEPMTAAWADTSTHLVAIVTMA
jgi:phosphopantetheine--protein transferase-like protein